MDGSNFRITKVVAAARACVLLPSFPWPVLATGVVADEKGSVPQVDHDMKKAPEAKKALRKSRSGPAPKRSTAKETTVQTSAVAPGEEMAPKDTEAHTQKGEDPREEGEPPRQEVPVERIGGDYLPDRKVTKSQHEKAGETLFACLMTMCFGGFLTLTGSKDNVGNECTNIGLVSALMLTIIVPMSYDNLSDWLEEDYVGSGTAFAESYIGKQLSESQIENALPWLHDVSLFFYAVGINGFLSSTIASIGMLLCVGELSTDAGCTEWLKRAGIFVRAPYFLLLSATLFVYAVLLRWVLAVKTLPGLICVSVSCITGYLSYAVVCFVYVRSCIKAHNRIHDFEDLNLSEDHAREDVEAWWKQNVKTAGTLKDCLHALDGKLTSSQSGLWPCITKAFLGIEQESTLVISLDGISKERVAMHYYKLRAESIGIKVSESKLELELYQLCSQQLAAC